MALAGGIVQPNRWAEVWERAHRWALKKAARVIVLGEDMRDRIIAKGVKPERVVIVRDGAPVPESVPSPDHPVAQEVRCGFSFVVLHAGNIGFYGAWDTLVKATRLLAGNGIGFVFVGDGAARPQVEAWARGCPGVRFLPFRPPEEVPYVLAAADLHVVTVRRGLEGVVVPSKLYPILAAGRPVLAVAPEGGDVVRIVRRTGCGVVADPDDPASVASAIQQVYQNRAKLVRMGQCARKIAIEYEREKQLRLFTHVIDGVLCPV